MGEGKGEGWRGLRGRERAPASAPGLSLSVLGQLLDDGRLEEAAQRCQVALDRGEASGGDPSVRHRLHHNLAVILYRLGRFDQARSHLAQALSLDPEVAESHFLHGLLVAGRGESAEAAAAFGRALALRPGWLTALLHRGASYFALGDYVRAREDFSAAAEALPQGGGRTEVLPLADSGLVGPRERKSFGARVPVGRRARVPSDQDPDLPTVLYDLALADVMVGRWDEAQALFRSLAAGDSEKSPSYYELLAQTYRAQTEDEFYGQLHRLKNLVGMVGDRLRLFREDASNLLDPALRHNLREVSTQYDLIYHDLAAFLGAVRREPLELDVTDIHHVLDGALVAALPEGSSSKPLAGAPAEFAVRRMEVLKDYSADLPPIVCDPALIREAFLNVILNALEAMQGEGVLSITTGRVVRQPTEEAETEEAERAAPQAAGRRATGEARPSPFRLPARHRAVAAPGGRPQRPGRPWRPTTPWSSPAAAGREASGSSTLAATGRKDPEEFIYVIFVDTGPGVAAEDAERIFHLGCSTKPFGSGIGLYQVRQAVAVHGGHIEVTPGGPGAAFTVYLPCRPRLSPSIEDLSPKVRLPQDARELIIEPAAAGEGDLLL